MWNFFWGGGGEGYVTTVEHSWYYPEKRTRVNRVAQLQHEINIISNNTTVINASGDFCKASLYNWKQIGQIIYPTITSELFVTD